MALRTLFRSSVLIGSNKSFSTVTTHTFSGMGVMGRSALPANMGPMGARKVLLHPQIFTSQFSTLTDPITKVDYGDIQTLLERDHVVKLRKRIEQDPRRRISLQEYQALATEEGLSKEQASRILQALSDSGAVLYFANSSNSKLKNTVFLKPTELNNTVHHLLEHYSPAVLKLQAEAVQAEIKDIIHQLEPLKEQRDVLEHKANTRANIIITAGLGYCVLQFLAIGRLTWWELSWDVMEPVTYMLTFATALIGYSYFVLTGSEYTFEGLKRTLRERRLSKLIKRSGFDEAKFKQLHIALQNKETKLHKILEEIAHNGPLPIPGVTTPGTPTPTSTPTPTPNSKATKPQPASA